MSDKLCNFVTFYVTSTKNVGTPLPIKTRRALVKRVTETLAESFGGCTVTKGVGYWKADSGKVIGESVTLVKSYHTLTEIQALEKVTPLAESIKSEFSQEAIAIETNTGIYFL